MFDMYTNTSVMIFIHIFILPLFSFNLYYYLLKPTKSKKVETNVLISCDISYLPAVLPQQKEYTLLVFFVLWLSALNYQVGFTCGCKEPCPIILSVLAVMQVN